MVISTANIRFAEASYLCTQKRENKVGMNRIKKQYKVILRLRSQQLRDLECQLRNKRADEAPAYSINKPERPIPQCLPIIYKSELDYISRCILDYPNIETGGQLFGYWTERGIPVVLFAIGPGERANHQTTFFNQDVQYLMMIGTELKNRFGLMHIGEWHSHHQLGLARPSGHDVSTMVSTIREKQLGRFLLCIGNCNRHSSSLNPFMCDEKTCQSTSWDVIFQDSPIRRPIYSQMKHVICDPHTRDASHMDSRLNGAPSQPGYSLNSWMRNKESGVLLNSMKGYVKSLHTNSAEVSVKLDDLGRVHIYTIDFAKGYSRWEEDIVFPDNFPTTGPKCRIADTRGTKEIEGRWERHEGVYEAFVQ